ncbi:hypothetical protein ATCC90586_000252 [Pythium insidiosum]|nr:hypothetical protein ATCC90586_000252 [Pythium insidiosum]
MQFSSDGQWLVSAGADGVLKLWATASLVAGGDAAPKPAHVFRGHDQGVSDVAWSHDGTYLVSASDDHTVRVWDAETRRAAAVFGAPTQRGAFLFRGLEGASTPTAGLDSSSAASTGNPSALGGAATSSGSAGAAAPADQDGHSTAVYCCAFNPQGTLIASGSVDESVRLWDVRTGRCLVVLLVHQEAVTGVAFSHDGTLLATSSYDGLVRIWDVATMQCLREIVVGTDARGAVVPATLVQFSPNSRYVLVGTMDGRLTLWDYHTPLRASCVATLRGHVNRRFCLGAAILKGPDGAAVVASGSEDGRVVFWDLATQQVTEELRHPHEPSGASSPVSPAQPPTATATASAVLGVSVHPSQRLLATSAGRTLVVWTASEQSS